MKQKPNSASENTSDKNQNNPKPEGKSGSQKQTSTSKKPPVIGFRSWSRWLWGGL